LNNRSRYFCTIAGERRKRRNENVDFKPLVCKTSKQLNINTYLADKAYDSEKNHEVCEKLRQDS